MTGADRPYLLERVDDAAVVQLYADGFALLDRRERVLAYHLYEAALAGRDIYYDQRFYASLDMRQIVEAVIRHAAVIESDTFARIQHYTKLFWLNSGPHNNLTARKFVPRCDPDLFDRAVRAAAADGARLPLRPGESMDGLLTRLRPIFFDPDVAPILTSKTPPSGQDILTASANNLYDGVTLADLKGFVERYPLNARLVKRDGVLSEEVYRRGGRYHHQIDTIIQHLTAATTVAPSATAHALEALIRLYETGDTADREAYDIAWLADRHAVVDTINGFIEVYLDARGTKGAWEAAVFYVNAEKTHAIRTLAANAQWFENQMPCDPSYRKRDVLGVTANAIDVIVESGDAGPVTPIGINLPNDDRIRTEYGSKSVSMSNVMHAADRALPTAYWSEFSWTPDEAERARRWASIAGELTTNMHEVIGHASGQSDPRLATTPQVALREAYSTIEETRADLVALFFLSNPRLAELGLVDPDHHGEIVRAEYEAYARNALVQLRRIREGTHIEEDHMRNRQLVVRWLMAHDAGIHERWRDGKTFYVVTDPRAVHDGVAALLHEVQRIKSQGDHRAACQLIEQYGAHFEASLRDEIVARVQRIDLPSYTGFVMPELQAIRDANGHVTDARITYPLDLTTQMLGYSAPGGFPLST